MIPEAGLLPGYPTTNRRRASPGLFGHYPKPGFSRAGRPLDDAGLLPDCPNVPRSRAAPVLSGYSPKSGFPSLPRLRKAFLRRQERVYMIFTILMYGKTSPLRAHTPDTNTYDTQWTRFMNISRFNNVCLFPIKSEHKLTFSPPQLERRHRQWSE